MKQETVEKIAALLQFIYREEYQKKDEEVLYEIINRYSGIEPRKKLNETDNFLIVYPDAITSNHKPSLKVLDSFLKTHADFITNVHLLPFYPYSSDDGYAVTDYERVREECGGWNEVERMSEHFGLVFDFVINHVSSKNVWFLKYMEGDLEYQKFFIEYQKDFDISKVVRPRPTPLFHEYCGKTGTKKLWTTFGEDQIDLNYGNFRVLARMCEVLAQYLQHGARCIRLDAVCYLWKESGENCCNMERTHAVIRLLRIIMDEIAPGSLLLTQTNVPHEDNLKYLGDGFNEAGLIYQFALPPLLLHTILSQNADKLTLWAKGINRSSDQATYFNFIGGHDGIGLRPVQNILSENEIKLMIENTLAQGGKVSYSVKPDGSREAYELNTNYLSALTCQDDSKELQLRKTLAVHSILCSLTGVPAVYYNALLGSENDLLGMEKSGIIRRINREKYEISRLEKLLERNKLRQEIMTNLGQMLRIRSGYSAFAPYNPQKIHTMGKAVFAVERYEENNKTSRVLSVTNVSGQVSSVLLSDCFRGKIIYNTCEEQKYQKGQLVLEPYGSAWIELIP